MVATAVHANKAATYLYEKATKGATINEVQNYQQAAEFAKSYAMEWATFNGDTNEYEHRLKLFNPSLSHPVPSGSISRVLSASVLSQERDAEGRYTVVVLLKTQHFGDLSDADAVPEAYKKEAPQPSVGYMTMAAKPKQKGWKDGQMTVQVSEGQKDGKFFVLNSPVLVSAVVALAAEVKRDYGARPTAPVVSAVTGFMKVYFSSENSADMVNFTTPESGITPVGGWEMKSLDNITVDSATSPAKASVIVTVVKKETTLQQHIYLSLKSQNGQVFVSKLSAEPN